MRGVRESLEAVRRSTGARSVVLLRATAGLLGLTPPVSVGEPVAPDAIGAALETAIPVPARTGAELAERIASLVGELRRGGAARHALRIVLPNTGDAHLLLVRGEEPPAFAGLALALDALAAQLRPPSHSHDVVEACAFLEDDGRLALLVDRDGEPLALSPLLRRCLARERGGRIAWVTPERRAFFDDLRQQIVRGLEEAPVRGLELPGVLRLLPVDDGRFLLGVVKGEVARAATLRALAASDVTPRELTCGLRLAEGKSYRTIADELRVSPDTVKLHLRALYQKLAVDGRDSLVARVAGLAPPPPVARRVG